MDIVKEEECEDMTFISDCDEPSEGEEDHISEIELSSDEDEEFDLPVHEDAPLTSKDQEITWSSTPCGKKFAVKSEFSTNPGPTDYATANVDDVLSAFQLFFPPSLMKIILENTNIEGARVYKNNWKELDIIALNAYIGLYLLTAVYKSHNESVENMWDVEKGRNIFRATMSLHTFRMISYVIRFDIRKTKHERQTNDKLAAIRDLWNVWREILPLMYNPSQFVVVGEQIIPFRGKCPFKQCVVNSNSRYGIKSWLLIDYSTQYIWNMQLYTGKSSDFSPDIVIMNLTNGLSGHNVTLGSFFTSYHLGQLLLEKNLTMIGSLKKTKTSIPSLLLQTKKMAKYSSKFAFTDTTTLVSYTPKSNKYAVYQSTLHSDNEIGFTKDKKPTIVLDYETTFEVTAKLEKELNNYCTRRKTGRWPMAVFSKIVDISVHNAFVIFTQVNVTWKHSTFCRKRSFIEELGEALIKPHIERRPHFPRDEAAKAIVKKFKIIDTIVPPPEVLAGCRASKRKRCQLCPRTDNKTSIVCINCYKFICKQHSVHVCTQCLH